MAQHPSSSTESYPLMQADLDNFSQLAARASEWAVEFTQQLPAKKVACLADVLPPPRQVARSGEGFAEALAQFQQHIAPYLSASAGPRYWGFVTGGASPAALLGDWLVSAIDQNVGSPGDSIATAIELQTIQWLLEMVALPASFKGILTTGATASNLLGLICGRQFAGQQQRVDVAEEGLSGVAVEVFSATPHASTVKCLAMLGLGRKSWRPISCLPGSEAMNVADLADQLAASSCPGKIVVASAGTVTGNDFDDLRAIADLCEQHRAWLHVDAAFGLFSRLLENMSDDSLGLERADSITSDAHKWLNVPYDCGLFFTRHPALLQQSCSADAAYLRTESGLPSMMNLGIENSRRFRALPLWLSLQAYGVEGVRHMVKANCLQAQQFAEWLQAAEEFDLLKPCRMNVVVFRPREADQETVATFLRTINESGEVYMTPGVWQGKPAIRAAFSNWRTSGDDVTRVCRLLSELVREPVKCK